MSGWLIFWRLVHGLCEVTFSLASLYVCCLYALAINTGRVVILSGHWPYAAIAASRAPTPGEAPR